MRPVAITSVRQVADLAFFQRGPRWIEGRLLDQEDQPPEVVVEFGTDAYGRLLQELASHHRHAAVTLGEEVYLLHAGRRVLVRFPQLAP